MVLRVGCDCCGAEFEALFPVEGQKSTQAYHCSCEVTKGRLIGHYGSAYDMSVYEFTRDALPDGHVVCDECVARMIEAGRLKDGGDA